MVWISSFQVVSYSSFEDSGEISLSRHFNIFAGANNSGKSSLIRCLHGQIGHNPHKSADRFLPGDLVNTVIRLHIETSTAEMRDVLAADGQTYQIPFSRTGDVAGEFRRRFSTDQHWGMHVRRGADPAFTLQDHGGLPWPLQQVENGSIRIAQGDVQFNYGDNGNPQIANVFNSPRYPTIFRFDAQRIPPSQISVWMAQSYFSVFSPT